VYTSRYFEQKEKEEKLAKVVVEIVKQTVYVLLRSI